MTVYERFVELASDLIEQCGVEQRKAVLEGIRAHLDRSGVGQRVDSVSRD